MKKLVIDTDPGVDDAIAIALACKANIELLALTTVYGNATLENTTVNAATILQIMKKKIPVYRGLDKPLSGNGYLSKVHGDNGFGGFRLNDLKIYAEKKPATDYLIELLNKDAIIDICAVGPVTNIAAIEKKSPGILGKINNLIILGGAVFEKGNVTPYAEFNIYNDPYSLDIILKVPGNKVLIPAEVCRKVTFTLEDFNSIQNRETRETFKKIAEIYIKYYTSQDEFAGFSGGVMYDLLTIAYVLDPSLFEVKKAHISVESKPGEYYGQTKIIRGKKPNCLLAINVNAEKLKKLFFEEMNKS
jgi:inosine-uridine nucleoside N-ribohydrolase